MTYTTYFPQPLTFSPSQKFFNNQKNLIQKLGFISPTTIDFHIKYSFQQIEQTYFIQGAEFEAFNSDHTIAQKWMIYKLGLANPKYLDILSAKINLESVKERVTQNIFWAIMAFPLRQRALFFILLLLLPKTIGKALVRINLIGMFIMLLFSLYKTFKTLFKRVQEQQTASIAGFDVQYAQHTDQLFFSAEMLSAIHKLKKLEITQVAYTGNCLYVYQTGISPALTQHTIQTLQSPMILSILSQSHELQQ